MSNPSRVVPTLFYRGTWTLSHWTRRRITSPHACGSERKGLMWLGWIWEWSYCFSPNWKWAQKARLILPLLPCSDPFKCTWFRSTWTNRSKCRSQQTLRNERPQVCNPENIQALRSVFCLSFFLNLSPRHIKTENRSRTVTLSKYDT